MKLFLVASFALIAFVSATPAGKANLALSHVQEDLRNARTYLLVEKEPEVYVVEDLVNSKIELQATANDATLYLYTRNNQENPVVLKVQDAASLASNQYFSNKRSNVFISHGWNNDYQSPVNRLITAAVLEKYDVNVFVVDWSGPANKNYLTAKNAVPTIGQAVGDFINDLISNYGFASSQFLLIGHSLGAHVAGCAGARVNGVIDTIVGLDPASPLFTMGNTDNRLDTTDASFVHIIHTNGGLLGFSAAIGHVDYYPNGGSSQPGCGIDLAGTCAHSRSYMYFAESIRNNKFVARNCDSFKNYSNGKCSSNVKSVMGGFKVDKSVDGEFYLETNSVEPFGEGKCL
ncbi:pancreatic triacylglycerol lipase [Aethina tumida]|uniref:pancreatic triacylglycerol lipase n=1 Tax=Aethina tumida TaxID=116153 RepID=UPI0021475329|nr:pancreatic triacylglycerol lipase [Aethina tumida]